MSAATKTAAVELELRDGQTVDHVRDLVRPSIARGVLGVTLFGAIHWAVIPVGALAGALLAIGALR